MALIHCGGRTYALVAKERLVGVGHCLNVGCGLLVYPGGEVAFRLVYKACPGWAVIHVHGYLYVLCVLLAGGQVADFFEAGIPGLTGSHAAVKGYGAGIRYSAAGGRSIEYLGSCDGAAAQEACIFPMLGIVFGVQHLHKSLYLGGIGGVVLVECAHVLQNVRHLVDGVVAALRG